MRDSTRHVATSIGLVAAVFVMLVTGAWIVESGGFALAVALILIAVIAAFVPFAVILHEEHDLPSYSRRTHT